MPEATPDESEFELEVLKKRGFVRKKCRVCGTYFWTTDAGRQTCGEAPCDPYTFLDRSPFNRSFDLRGFREYFLDYFHERGHAVIPPRPVVARWRNDLYLTSASIVLFQPYVTSGLVPPPANPLVVAQPCVRFVDIDRVGLTAGRHLTTFEMGGAHAFNYPDKQVYWKDQTVEYGLDLLNSLGVPDSSITLKEDLWEGGGNAGPAFEVIVGGLELETLVFMKYSEEGGLLHEIPIKVVDTGYGLERFTWMSQATPTAFEAIFSNTLPQFLDLAGVEPPSKELLKSMAIASINALKLEVGMDEAISKGMGMSLAEYAKRVKPYQMVGALLDHTRTIAFLLSDGVIPSNTGEGYLARLIIRRALRLKWALGMSTPLSQLLEMQIEDWGKDFPWLLHAQQRSLELTDMEEQKYNDALQRGLGILERRIQSVGKVDEETLLQLYDSYGVPVEVIVKALGEKGVEAQIPEDFYSQLASRHSAVGSIRLSEKGESKDVPDPAILELPATLPLFHEGLVGKIKAQVVYSAEIAGRRLVVTDRTNFYPEGGGQPSDVGSISWNGGMARVQRAFKAGPVVVHELEGEGPLPKKGETAELSIDGGRRLQLMRAHTATHLVLAACRQILGDHVWQMGAQKDVDLSRLDILHYKAISEDQLDRIEGLANSWVMADIPVEVLELERDLAEAAFGYQIYQGGVVPGKRLRVVRIPGVDVEACGGTHVSRTGEVGQIKIQSVTRIQESVFRIMFSAGEAARVRSRRLSQIVARLEDEFNCKEQDVVDRVQVLKQQVKEGREKASVLQKELLQLKARVAPQLETPAGAAKLVRCPEGIEPREAAIAGTESADVVLAVSADGRKLAVAARRGSGRSLEPMKGILSKLGKGGGSSELLEYVLSQPFDEILLTKHQG